MSALQRHADDPFDEINPELEGDHLDREPNTARLNTETLNREAWLHRAVDLLTPLLEQAGALNLRHRQISVSVGFPSTSVRTRIGECWPGMSSGNGIVNHMFINPKIDDPIQVLGILAHELIHADDHGASHHNGHFRRVAHALGLTGKMTSTVVGAELENILKDMLTELGPYPHIRLNIGPRKVQNTRMLKAVCSDDYCAYTDAKNMRYTVRLTAKWVAVGMPSCPCGSEMKIED